MNRKFLCMLMILSVLLFAACTKEEDGNTGDGGSPASGGNVSSNESSNESGNATTGEDIPIGIIAPLTGGAAVYGIAARDGAVLAFEEINAANGVLGSRIRVIEYDDQHSPPEAINAYNRLVNQDNVIAIVGPVTSAPANAAGAAAATDRTPMISPTGTQEDVTSYGDFIFRACFLDNFQARSMAVFAKTQLNAGTAAILYDAGNAYSEGLAENFRSEFIARGGTVIADEAYNTDDVDFRTQLTSIRAAGADVLFLPDYYNTVAMIATQARELGVTSVMLGADGWEGIFDVLDDHSIMNGTFYSSHFASDDPDVAGFISDFTARFGSPPNSFAALGYDAAKIMAQAISEAGSTDNEAIITAMKNINFSGVTGNITFDAQGDPIKDLIVITIETTDNETAARFYSRVSPN